jgi:hypothetical protein
MSSDKSDKESSHANHNPSDEKALGYDVVSSIHEKRPKGYDPKDVAAAQMVAYLRH